MLVLGYRGTLTNMMPAAVPAVLGATLVVVGTRLPMRVADVL